MTTEEVRDDPEGSDGERVEIEPMRQTALAPATLFGTSDPLAIIGKATEIARALNEVVRAQGLIAGIPCRDHKPTFRAGCTTCKEHPKVEAWTFLGSMLGVFPVCTWTHAIEGGFEARVEARTMAGTVVGSAESQCTRTEYMWAKRDDYALRSMAQTRATSKAMRQPLGFVMQLAGFDPTPAEEMPRDVPEVEVRVLPSNVSGASLPKPVEVERVTDVRAQWLAAEYARKLPKREGETEDQARARRIDDVKKITGNGRISTFKGLTKQDAEGLEEWLATLPDAAAVGGRKSAPPRTDNATDTAPAPAAAHEPITKKEEVARGNRVTALAHQAGLYDANWHSIKLDAERAQMLGFPAAGNVTASEIARGENYDAVLSWLEAQAAAAEKQVAEPKGVDDGLPF